MPHHPSQISYQSVNNFIIAIKCCAMQQIHRYLKQFGNAIVNRLETQSRQPALYVAAILIDHQQSYEIMKLLLQHHANPHFKDNYQQTVMFYVCREGKEKCLDLLLHHGLSVDEEDIYGQTPLFYVAKQNRINIIHKMIQKKVNVNHADKIANQTALFYAARQGNLDMCKILIQAGCDVLHTDSTNKNAAHYAKKFNNNEVYEYLSNEIQNMKQQRKIIGDSKGPESNQPEEKNTKKQKKREIALTPPTKATYRLYRADALGNTTQLTMQDFEQLMSEYPDLAQKFRNPDEIDMSNLQEIKAKQAWVKTAQRILTLCQKAKGGYFFLQPVDPAKYGIDDYFEIIQQPMDFGTIKKKLNHNVYNNIQQYIYDMKLVFDNCVKYNGKQNQIAKYAIEIKNMFEENMKQTGFMN